MKTLFTILMLVSVCVGQDQWSMIGVEGIRTVSTGSVTRNVVNYYDRNVSQRIAKTERSCTQLGYEIGLTIGADADQSDYRVVNNGDGSIELMSGTESVMPINSKVSNGLEIIINDATMTLNYNDHVMCTMIACNEIMVGLPIEYMTTILKVYEITCEIELLDQVMNETDRMAVLPIIGAMILMDSEPCYELPDYKLIFILVTSILGSFSALISVVLAYMIKKNHSAVKSVALPSSDRYSIHL
jgi:hypothetical protein